LLSVLIIRRLPSSTLFPYTTLFRSRLWINHIEACTLTAHEDISSAIKIHRKDAIEAFRQLVAVADFLERIMSIAGDNARNVAGRSEEHTSELQSRENLVCRLLLEKK